MVADATCVGMKANKPDPTQHDLQSRVDVGHVPHPHPPNWSVCDPVIPCAEETSPEVGRHVALEHTGRLACLEVTNSGEMRLILLFARPFEHVSMRPRQPTSSVEVMPLHGHRLAGRSAGERLELTSVLFFGSDVRRISPKRHIYPDSTLGPNPLEGSGPNHPDRGRPGRTNP